MDRTEPTSNARRWNPWPVAIVAFFAVAITGCAAFVIFCARHPAELVAADYYEQEMRYGQQLDRLQRTQRDSQTARVAYDAATETISISVPPQPAAGQLTGTIQLYRPSAGDLDREFKLQLDATGRQTIDARPLASGLWKVRVSWAAGSQEYFIDQKIVIGPSGS